MTDGESATLAWLRNAGRWFAPIAIVVPLGFLVVLAVRYASDGSGSHAIAAASGIAAMLLFSVAAYLLISAPVRKAVRFRRNLLARTDSGTVAEVIHDLRVADSERSLGTYSPRLRNLVIDDDGIEFLDSDESIGAFDWGRLRGASWLGDDDGRVRLDVRNGPSFRFQLLRTAGGLARPATAKSVDSFVSKLRGRTPT